MLAGTAAAQQRLQPYVLAWRPGRCKQTRVLDHAELQHVAQFPYEVVVHQGRVRALHPRFRLALNFPDVKMVGENSFMQLRNAPDEIRVVLKLLSGGQ